MKFTLEIECDNVAFERNPEAEVSRILRAVGKRIENEALLGGGKVLDVNGNTVGRFEFVTE